MSCYLARSIKKPVLHIIIISFAGRYGVAVNETTIMFIITKKPTIYKKCTLSREKRLDIII